MPPPANIDRRRRRHDHDVFISFRGSDVRNTFVDHLRVALRREGIKVFADDSSDDLPRGENVKEMISVAIERSKLYAVVLSPNYASSEWCLDELVHIMRCCRHNKAIPIFYHLSPEEVTGDDCNGCYEDVLKRHKSRYTNERVKGWLQALAWIAGISGWVVTCGQSEARLVERISKTMGGKLREIVPATVGRVPSPDLMEDWISPSHAVGKSASPSPIRSSPSSRGSSDGSFVFSLLLLLGFGLLVLCFLSRKEPL